MTHIFQQLPSHHKRLIIVLSVIVTILFLLPSDDAKASRSSDSNTTLKIAQRYHVPLDVTSSEIEPIQKQILIPQDDVTSKVTSAKTMLPKVESLEKPSQLTWQTVTIKAGDNLALIFGRAGFSARTLHEITSNDKASVPLRNILPGQTIRFGKNAEGQLIELQYKQDIVNSLLVAFVDDKYHVTIEKRELETREKLASAMIKDNFWNAGISAGLEPNVIMNLANIFGWDIDFGLGIRQGDYFNIIYETKFLDGVEVKMGNIIAAEFVNRGQSYQAIRHTDGEYYSPSGRNMRKAFLRAPVNFKYISSSFNPRRLHPVTGRITAHNGIDYAAKRGTPVQASGSGTVIASGYNKYNGNYIFIKHGERYVTKYLHLTKKYVRKGARVKQGQKIGTVGSTGRVTGAHLHYEFLVNGVHHNPRTIKLPKAQSIARKEKRKFLTIAKSRIKQLETNKRIMLAVNQE